MNIKFTIAKIHDVPEIDGDILKFTNFQYPLGAVVSAGRSLCVPFIGILQYSINTFGQIYR
jgi:hypothetical protein